MEKIINMYLNCLIYKEKADNVKKKSWQSWDFFNVLKNGLDSTWNQLSNTSEDCVCLNNLILNVSRTSLEKKEIYSDVAIFQFLDIICT